ncbi:MAG: PKD domain-containing protein [Planctomycetes bacterium]|nr:PKD domain-containing protein [Planctomycetota bacterium]
MIRPFAFLVCAAVLSAQSPIQSTFVGGTGVFSIASPATALFDFQVLDPNGLTIRMVEAQCNAVAATTGTLGVWVTAAGGTHVGNHLNAAVWTQVGTSTRTHSGGRVAFTLATPFYLPPGTYGMALHHVGTTPLYANPTTVGLPATYATTEAVLDTTFARFRASDPVNPFGGTAAGFTPRHPEIAIHYSSGPVSVDFTGTPLRGASPLPVQFTSIAFSGNPGGILAYAWDFDNDGITDSNLPNPAWTYTACGNYTVALTIVDSTGPFTVTKNNYVQTDVVVPSFQNQLIAVNTLQFTDTSSPTPTAWDWDLDGDNVTDSTVQNPVFTYPSGCGEVVVTLRTSLACQPQVTYVKRIAVATSLESTFQGGLVTVAGAPGATSFVDVDVTNPQGITVCGMHVNSSVAAAGTVTVNVFQKAGTYVGATGDASQWRQVAATTAVSLGTNGRTFVSLVPPLHLAQGVHGLAIEQLGASPVYTNLGGLQTYTTPDCSLTVGLVQALPTFAAASTTYSPRTVNLALHYATTQQNGAAGYGYIGAGCAGSLGVPGNRSTTQPVLGGAATIVIDRLPFDLGVLALGFSRSLSAIGPLPVDLGLIGMPGCPLRVSFEATLTMLGAGNTASVVFPVPSTTALVGALVYSQALSFDPALNAFGFAISDAAAMLVGQ